jgi:hypothetical protein
MKQRKSCICIIDEANEYKSDYSDWTALFATTRFADTYDVYVVSTDVQRFKDSTLGFFLAQQSTIDQITYHESSPTTRATYLRKFELMSDCENVRTIKQYNNGVFIDYKYYVNIATMIDYEDIWPLLEDHLPTSKEVWFSTNNYERVLFHDFFVCNDYFAFSIAQNVFYFAKTQIAKNDLYWYGSVVKTWQGLDFNQSSRVMTNNLESHLIYVHFARTDESK